MKAIATFLFLFIGIAEVLSLSEPLRLVSAFSHITGELDKLSLGNCSLKGLELPLNHTKTRLPGPSSHLSLKFVAIGRGTQNYSCSSSETSSHPKKSSTPVATGAAATLFDASCLASQSLTLLHEFPAAIGHISPGSLAFMAEALTLITNTSELIIGEHYFNTAGDPFFDLSMSGLDMWIDAKKKASVNAPTRVSRSSGKDESDVPWLKLGCKNCKDIQEVYRVLTFEGVAPSTCMGQNDTVLIQYAAEYWFYG
ncbi:hypothetical protein N7532_008360 [Penicillium argentinense]|uniref:Uncharacterized protein n=1 Tax=Penicillium argentinense TaxID=1131581 RepID=A0A9W9EXF5_9EURO|nr:uncharacterized protein N7532_008360 [Penicillium argentinense]KAJ5089676.1 hypothetical protein N7532_008360 [Penicillium argentinense]